LVLLLLFFIPIGNTNIVNGLFVILLIHSLFFLSSKDWKAAFTCPIFLWVGGFYLLHVLNLFHASDMAEGGRQLEIKAPFLLGSLLVVANKRLYIKEIKSKGLNAFLYGTIVICLIALIYAGLESLREGAWYFTSESGKKIMYFTYIKLATPFMHPGYFSTYVGFSIFISMGRVFSLKGNRKIGEVIIILFLLIMMILLQGRINILALFAVFGLGGIFYAIKFKMYKLLAVPAVGAIVLVAVFILGSNKSENRFLQMPDFSYDITGDKFNSATYRLAEWTCAADVISENILFGTGVGDNRKTLLDAYAARVENTEYDEALHASKVCPVNIIQVKII